ncbi:MAG TPA: DNA cytosine methyltransferase [Noviherbaspirillum sp.]|nr:DNA cytosine methyltransferase [Noviherbaspirillum sp.]
MLNKEATLDKVTEEVIDHTTESTSTPANQLRLLSLFCGPGGLDEGFKQAGFETAVAFDIDRDCVNTFNKNHGNGKTVAYKYDLRDVTPEVIYDLAGKDFAPIGVVGGPPCQSFSVSNVFQSDDDPRHSLPSTYAQLLKKLNDKQPISFFLFENVPGLLGEKHRHRLERFKRQFREAGFKIYLETLNAKHFGVPQERERVFIVGINKKLHPKAEWKWPSPEERIKTVRETIEHLPEPVFNEKGLDPSTIPLHPNHWSMVPRSKKFTTEGALLEGQAWGRSFRTLKWDEPSWTVAYGNREVHVHPKGHRRLSMYEAMRLQSFPDHYTLVGNISAQTRLVSEAVAPRMAWHLANAIRQCLGI